jgi:phosphoglycerol transferase
VKGKLKVVAQYAGAVILCLLILTWVMKLWRADLKVPFAYFGDAVFFSAALKGGIEQGWWFHNISVGAPTGSNFYALPAVDNFQFLLIKVISLFTTDYALTLNLFYLLTFPLTTITSLYFFRHFKFSYGPALLGSLLYTFLPFHFFRTYHLFLTAYYLLPLMTLVILWLCSGKPFLVEPVENRRWPKFELKSYKSIFSIIICALVGSCGIYYPFFSCFLLLIAGISASVYRKSIHALLASVILVGFMSVVVLVNLSSRIIYQHNHAGSSIGVRPAQDAEILGLKITQLVLPIGGHRIPALAELKYQYNLGPLITENDTASLGIVGSIGFLILIFWLLFKKSENSMLNHLSILNGSALLLGTIGGFGSLFALLISPQIRGYNRISVFIAFFSLAAVVQLLDAFSRKYLKSFKAQLSYLLFLSLVIVAGVLDQTSTTFFFVPEYDQIKNEYQSDSDFVANIEASLPAHAMIFQLPYVQFPESPPVNKMIDYELFKAYLHSKTLRWSYGTIKDETDDLWKRAVAAKPANEFVEEISRAGFMGIYINRDGYADNAAMLEAELTALLGVKPLASRKGNLIFFNLLDYQNRLKGG